MGERLLRKTKIIATVGPASVSEDILRDIILSGANVIRINFSHESHPVHAQRIECVKKLRKELNRPVAILVDSKGPEIRIGTFKNERVELEAGQTFTFYIDDVEGDKTGVSISFKEITNDVTEGTRILIDDGLVELVVKKVEEKAVVCEVLNGATISNRKGVNIPGISLALPAMTEKDKEDIKFAIEQDVEFIAISFARKATHMMEIREFIEKNGGKNIKLVAKIENEEGINNIDDIIKVSDAVMVARGDLGVEMPTEEVPVMQKMIIKKCVKAGKPAITATQMLDSMMRNPRPTRAEASDVANAIYDGTSAIMLSGETAIGKYPLEVVQTMSRIAERMEKSIEALPTFDPKEIEATTVTDAISSATCLTAENLKAAAIVTPTRSGYTARMLSKFRPQAPIIAPTTSERTYQQLAISWGVYPYMTEDVENTDQLLEKAVSCAAQTDFVKDGDVVVITAGVPAAVSGTTNLIKVHIMGNILAKGKGIGTKAVTGKVCIVDDKEDSVMSFEKGCILVTKHSSNKLLKCMRDAIGIISEEGSVNSPAAIMGVSLEKPTIVGATNACELLYDGMTITIDPVRGIVYNGEARVI